MAKRRTRQKWQVGDVFSVPQEDGLCSLGQVIDLPMPHVPSVALYDIRCSKDAKPGLASLPFEKVLCVASTTADGLEQGYWKVLFNLPVRLQREFWPNEACRDSNWVGAITQGAGI